MFLCCIGAATHHKLGLFRFLRFAVVPVMTKIRDMFYRHNDAGMYDSRSIGIALATAEKWFICGSSALFCVVFLAVADFGANLNELIWFWVSFSFGIPWFLLLPGLT